MLPFARSGVPDVYRYDSRSCLLLVYGRLGWRVNSAEDKRSRKSHFDAGCRYLEATVGNAVLDLVLADGFLDNVMQRGEQLSEGLKALGRRYQGLVEEVRGVGLMWGVKCTGPNTELAGKMFDKGLLNVLAADNVVRLLPPLIVEEKHIDEALGIVEACFQEMSK